VAREVGRARHEATMLTLYGPNFLNIKKFMQLAELTLIFQVDSTVINIIIAKKL